MAQFNRSNLQLFLNRLTSRSVLTEEEQQAVLNLPGHAEQVHSNRDFVPLGTRVDHACLVIAGIVGRFDQDGAGTRQITAMHVPGDMCDLHSVVQPMPTSALQSLSVATIMRVPHAAIRAAAARYPAVAEALWRDCTVDAAILCEWVVNVGRRDAKTRIAHLLCELATRLHATGNGGDRDPDATCRGDGDDRRSRQPHAPEPQGRRSHRVAPARDPHSTVGCARRARRVRCRLPTSRIGSRAALEDRSGELDWCRRLVAASPAAAFGPQNERLAGCCKRRSKRPNLGESRKPPTRRRFTVRVSLHPTPSRSGSAYGGCVQHRRCSCTRGEHPRREGFRSLKCRPFPKNSGSRLRLHLG